MKVADLLAALPPRPLGAVPFPRHLLGAFRRKSITFCTGLTDEVTPVYWFQSRSFTLDLRLPGRDDTALTARQGWVGDTLWDAQRGEMSWSVARSYQPRNQWPEPARLAFIGNSVLEFAPSGAYVEDWRQLAAPGPLLGLRLHLLREHATGTDHAMDGGLIVAGAHMALARSRLPAIDAALATTPSLDHALAQGIISAAQIASYEVSVALDGAHVTHTTIPARHGKRLLQGDFAIEADGQVHQHCTIDSMACTLVYSLDVHEPVFAFVTQTPTTSGGQAWLEAEREHLERNARVLR
ncbi:hypothetical protein [Novosphingobium sp. B-7]|uniref:hypothetical protein n=1 Tax=Novosphingobium sp. B-7 TaxID=1298855 RepID=UPI0003B39B4D|nr:hypothetical protein [Novosphingobium sp. B-7]